MIPRMQIPLTRRLKGTYSNGVYAPGAQTSTTIRASVQPTSPDDLLSLPEGRRTTASYKLYTNNLIQEQTSTHDPDVVTLFGEKYEVVKIFNWQNNLISHTKAIAVKLENPS
jgi:hypothetical protein